MGRRMGVGIADGVAVCGGPLEVLWRRAPAIVDFSQHRFVRSCACSPEEMAGYLSREMIRENYLDCFGSPPHNLVWTIN